MSALQTVTPETQAASIIVAIDAPRTAPDQVFGIQYLRAFAALAVVFHHTIEIASSVHPDIPTFVILAGASGVDVFFVISGFIMMNSAFAPGRAPLTPFEFITRRIQRIYPLYWLLALPIVIGIALGFDTQQHHTLMSTIRAVLLLPSETNVLWYSWTLKYEMFFYAIFALFLFSRNQGATAFGAAAALAVLGLLAPTVGDPATRAFLSNSIVFEFSLGLGLGALYRARPHLFTARRKWLAIAAVLSAMLIIVAPQLRFRMDHLLGPAADIRLFIWGAPAAIIVAWAIGFPALKGRTGQGLLLLGNASYALYLAHFFVMKGFIFLHNKFEWSRTCPQILLGALMIAASVGLALVLHLAYEKPVARVMAQWRKAWRLRYAHAVPRPL